MEELKGTTAEYEAVMKNITEELENLHKRERELREQQRELRHQLMRSRMEERRSMNGHRFARPERVSSEAPKTKTEE